MTLARRLVLPFALAAALAAPTAAFAARAVEPSADVLATVEHVNATRDNAGAPFIVIDKKRARLWLYDAGGRAVGNAPVLLGYARGDDTVPGIGDKPLAQVRPWERTTPAGRFVAEHGRNTHGDDILWVDYDAAVSLHRMRQIHASERRAQRLASPSIADNRISYGCINVPPDFYDGVILPLVGKGRPVIYLLPETRAAATIFAAGRSAAAAAKGAS